MKRKKQGVLFVEAALFLPVFLTAALSLSSLIAFLAVNERTLDAFEQEAEFTAKQSYLLYAGEPSGVLPGIVSGSVGSRLQMLQRLQDRLGEPYRKQSEKIRLRNWNYLYSRNGFDGMIEGVLCYEYEMPFVLRFTENPVWEQTVRFRAFIGSDSQRQPLGFEAMETDENGGLVWIFPQYGSCYHKESCRTISVYPKQAVLTPVLRKKYRPCAVCNPETLGDGAMVYCFRTGAAYHRKSCSSIEKYVMAIERSEAERRGYSACAICGG